jgi:protein-tyrosine phosphatase
MDPHGAYRHISENLEASRPGRPGTDDPGWRRGHGTVEGRNEPELILIDILVVCTANVARSPLLAVLLQHHADERLGAERIQVGSAGTDARMGDPAAPGSCRVATGWGLSLEGHRAQPLRFAPIDDVAVIIAMSRRQARLIGRRDSTRAPHTFALRELVAAIERLDLATTLGDPPAPPGSARDRLSIVVAAAGRVRPRTALRRGWDVPDPIGGDDEVYDALGEEFERTARTLADALFGPST